MPATSPQHWTAKRARAAFTAATVVEIGALCPGGDLLVVSPHPDDESLGCGGLIALAAEAGCRVVVASLTDGAASHPNSRLYPPDRLAALRRTELDEALGHLADRLVEVERFGAADGRLADRETEASAWLSALGGRKGFHAVFTTWAADPHPDHKAAFRIASRAAATWESGLFAYPIWGLTLPDHADAGPVSACVKLDITEVLDRKRAAIGAYRSQTGDLIDGPGGFRLSPSDLARHLSPFEVFIRADERLR